jgi:hypothetical protein
MATKNKKDSIARQDCRSFNGTRANQHDLGFARMFTGAPLVARGGQPWGGAASVDQLLANRWNVESLTVAVLASAVEAAPQSRLRPSAVVLVPRAGDAQRAAHGSRSRVPAPVSAA